MYGKIRELNQIAREIAAWKAKIKEALTTGAAVGMSLYPGCPFPPGISSWNNLQATLAAIDALTEAQTFSYGEALLVFAGDLQDPG